MYFIEVEDKTKYKLPVYEGPVLKCLYLVNSSARAGYEAINEKRLS